MEARTAAADAELASPRSRADVSALILSHRALALRLSGEFRRRFGGRLDDAYSDALVGIWKAAERFDPDKGPFFFFARLWARHEMADGRRRRAYRKLGQRLPPDASLDSSGLTDGPTDHGLPSGAILPDGRTSHEEQVAAREALEVLLARLTARQREALWAWIGCGGRQKQAARAIGCSPTAFNDRREKGLRAARALAKEWGWI